jgi:hypothetical protein
MTDMDALDDTACPYLRPSVDAPMTTLTVAVYCGLPSGRARVPSRDELLTFCIGGHHRDCPGYHRARMREAFASGLA